MLSLSIHREGSKPPHNAAFRAFLWNGRIPKLGDDTLWVADFSAQNIFVSLEALKTSAREWANRGKKNRIVAGIHTPAPCWPLDTAIGPGLSVEELEACTLRHIIHCGGFKGLLAVIARADDKHRVALYDVLPFPPPDSAISALVNCSYWDSNLFVVAEKLRCIVQAAARSMGILSVRGLDDDAPCWPQGLGEFRYS